MIYRALLLALPVCLSPATLAQEVPTESPSAREEQVDGPVMSAAVSLAQIAIVQATFEALAPIDSVRLNSFIIDEFEDEDFRSTADLLDDLHHKRSHQDIAEFVLTGAKYYSFDKALFHFVKDHYRLPHLSWDDAQVRKHFTIIALYLFTKDMAAAARSRVDSGEPLPGDKAWLRFGGLHSIASMINVTPAPVQDTAGEPRPSPRTTGTLTASLGLDGQRRLLLASLGVAQVRPSTHLRLAASDDAGDDDGSEDMEIDPMLTNVIVGVAQGSLENALQDPQSVYDRVGELVARGASPSVRRAFEDASRYDIIQLADSEYDSVQAHGRSQGYDAVDAPAMIATAFPILAKGEDGQYEKVGDALDGRVYDTVPDATYVEVVTAMGVNFWRREGDHSGESAQRAATTFDYAHGNLWGGAGDQPEDLREGIDKFVVTVSEEGPGELDAEAHEEERDNREEDRQERGE